jgi:hypothetical protein
MSGYETRTGQLKKHADILESIAAAWESSVHGLVNGNDVSIDPDAFTRAGGYVAEVYGSTSGSYRGHSAGVMQALNQVVAAIRLTEKTYGKTAAAVEADLKKLERPQSPGPVSPQSGLNWLLP